MFGEIGSWFYEALGGILPDEKQPGFKHIILKPHFVSGLDQFEAKYESVTGEITSSWSKNRKGIAYKVIIPPNSSASLFLSKKATTKDRSLKRESLGNQYVYDLPSGTHQFTISNR